MYENAKYADSAHQSIIANRNGETVGIPVDAGNSEYRDLIASGAPIANYQTPAPSAQAIDAERDRRMETFTHSGVDYNFDPDSRDNISGAAVLALGAISAGAQPDDLRWANPDQDFGWIALDNSVIPMDAQTCWEFAQAAASYKSALIFAARTLKDMDPIPANYDDNSYWP